MGPPIGRTLENDVILSVGMNRRPTNFSEDERDKLKDDIQELTKKYEAMAGDMAKKREDEVMEG